MSIEEARGFQAVPQPKPGADRSVCRQDFLNHLSGSKEDWQVKQALEAIQHSFFWSASKAPVEKTQATHVNQDCGRAINECRNGLALRGRSYRTVQELLGHANLQTTMIYTHVARKNVLGVRSPMNALM